MKIKSLGVFQGRLIMPGGKPPSALQAWLVKLLARWRPQAGVLQLDPALVSRDPIVVANYSADPLVHSGKVTAKLAVSLGAGMAKVHEEAKRIHLPILVLQGQQDQLVNPAGAELLINSVATTDKTLHWFEPCYHEILNEPERHQVLATMSQWLAGRQNTQV